MAEPKTFLIDYHCHLDLYPDYQQQFRACASNNIATLAVTTTPRAWARNQELAANCPSVRVGLGIHPQLVEKNKTELPLFEKLLPQTKYVGEIGLDAGPAFHKTYPQQMNIFENILRLCGQSGGKILSVHSVRAMRDTLKMIERHIAQTTSKAVLHWFSGTPSEASIAAELGCYFSVNMAMLKRMGDLFLCMFDLHLRNAIHENRTNQEGLEAYHHRLNMFLFQMLIGGDGSECSIEKIKLHITTNWRMEIIPAPANHQFITSDHPAIFMTCSSSAPKPSRALQMMLLPLEPKHTAIAFDKRFVSLQKMTASEKDMQTLNAWQIHNAKNCIYSARELRDEEVSICRSHLIQKQNRECAIDEHGWKLYTAYLPHESHFSFMKVKPPLF